MAAAGPGVDAAIMAASSRRPAIVASSTSSITDAVSRPAIHSVHNFARMTPRPISEQTTSGYIIIPPSAKSVSNS